MKSIKIWDPAVRLFHWSLVAGFAANALILSEESKAHIWVGYAVLALVLFRLVWGVTGPRYARFSSFTPHKADVMDQLSDMATRRRRVHPGHSPLGALMIFNLLASLIIIGITGYLMTTDMFWGVDWVEEAHEIFVSWAELSVVLHITAVFIESARTGINLPRAMLTGRKVVPSDVNLVE